MEKIPKILTITSRKPAFNLVIDSVAVNGHEIPKSLSFAPAAERIDENHQIELLINSNICFNDIIDSFWVLRFRYEDIFHNEYFQDVPLIYEETKKYSIPVQSIKICDIRSPVLRKNAKPIEDACKEYQDYQYFCKSHNW